ncbi:MAG TPA: nuclear transport factor 2 family protein [Chitinophagaceae bacterium]|nr:nuclear transport factor 2 family protein [Chitinophagaceae bacterium]
MNKHILLGCIIFLCSSGHTQTNTSKDEAQIRAARAASNAAIAKHDVDGLAECLAPEFIMVTGNAQQFIGKDVVVARWKDFFAKNSTTFYIRTPAQVVISKNDTLAFETGTWKGINSYSAGGNYTAMWCKRNNVWMTRAELYISLLK